MNKREKFEEKSLVEMLEELIEECQKFNAEIEELIKNPLWLLPVEKMKEMEK